jgi:hypothetical protein
MTVFKLGTTIKNFIDALNANFSELSNKGSYKVLYDGTAEIPSKSSGETNTITLNDDITKYDGVIIQRETTGAWQRFDNLSVGTVLKVMNTESDFEYVEGCNLFMCNAEITATNKLKLSNNVYSGVKTSAAGRYMESFGDRPLNKVIGIKLN